MESDTCAICGHALRLTNNPWEQEQPVRIGPRQEICPECYRNLSAAEKKRCFND